MRTVRLGVLGLVTIVLVGCGEKVQTIPPAGERKSDDAYTEWLRQLRDQTYVEVRLEDR